jgi:hypothetical protein
MNTKKFFNKNVVIGFLIIIFSLGTLLGGAYFFYKNQQAKTAKTKINESVSSIKDNSDPAIDSSVSTDEAVPIEAVSETIGKGSVKWQNPEDLGDLGLTSRKIYEGCHGDCEGDVDSNGVKYVKVGEVSSGKYQGYDFLVILSGVTEGPWILPDMYRTLRKGNDFVFDTNPAYGFSSYIKDFVTSTFSSGSGKKEFENIAVEDLDYPDELLGVNDRQRFERDPYGNAFFTEAKLKKAFFSDTYGQVWMTDEVKVDKADPANFELNSYLDYQGKKSYYDIFDRYGFYLKAPDGTTVVYKMKFDIFDKTDRNGVLQATWDGGKRNEDSFEENPGGCGNSDYVYDETLKVNPDTDLIAIGKTDQGDVLWGYRSAEASGFKELYDNVYWVPDKEKKKSPEEFLKGHPKIFWKDYFGRILAFYNTNIISPAECGKPVIYLYPEEDQNVHVEVNPGNGLSYTDPEYRSGWNVFARKNGELVNSVDGKSYPYLFWEGAGDIYYETPKEGFVVSKEELSGFFDDKLSKLGLSQKEAADFKEFWIPKMGELQKPYYFVTFLSKRYVDAIAPLKVSPAPDSVIRVMMDYRGLDKFESVSVLNIKTPERKGFSVVEWGGMLK